MKLGEHLKNIADQEDGRLNYELLGYILSGGPKGKVWVIPRL
jgi:hypothetical protein